ncbi:MAG: MBL fold metallo-hydrolase [Myxococcota bacterium]
MSSKLTLETISDGLRKIAVPSPTLPPATHTNSWILGKDGDCIIVDPAGHIPIVQQAHIELLKKISPKAILLTHHHRDHVAGAKAIQAHFDIPIWAHANNTSLVKLKINRFLTDNEFLKFDGREWRILFTPGHAPGHIALLDRKNRHCICGDLVAGVGTIVLNPPEGDLSQYLSSLQRLIDENVTCLHPAHGPSIKNAISYLQHYIDHRNHRTAQMKNCLSQKPITVLEIANQIYPEHIGTPVLAIAGRQICCHLEWLKSEGQAIETDSGWICTPD